MDAMEIKREIEKLKSEGKTSYENCDKLVRLEKAYKYLCGDEESDSMPNVYVTAYDNTYNAAGGSVHPLTRQSAEEWVSRMENVDGSTGGHWTLDQTEQVRIQRGFDCDPVKFWVAINMMYSDYYMAAKKNNANTIDFYADMAKAFLDDPDAQTGKLSRYREYIAGTGSTDHTMSRSGSSEFMELVSSKDPAEAWKVIDRHMQRMKEVNPRVYNIVIERLRGL